LFRLVKWYLSWNASSTMGEPDGRHTLPKQESPLQQRLPEQGIPWLRQPGGGLRQSPLVHIVSPVQPAFEPGSQLAQQPL
jgi:hypothetical protein